MKDLFSLENIILNSITKDLSTASKYKKQPLEHTKYEAILKS